MTFQTTARIASTAAVAALLAACGAAPSTPVVNAPVAAKKAAAKTVKSPTITYINNVTTVPVLADAATVNLEFSIKDEALSRKLMQVAAAANILPQIDHVVFTLTGPALAAPLTATVPRAKFLDNKAVIQFNHLPPGAITITAVAKDAAGNKVIEANGGGAIKVGELTKVKLTCVAPPATGTGHVRIEMDCFSADCQPQPNPSPTSFVPDPVVDVKFHSLGDPHEEGANGLKFENQETGTFLGMRTLTNDFMLVKSQGPDKTGQWPGATVNNAVAIKANGDVFQWYLYGRRIRMNGATVPATPGMVIQGRNGTKVTFLAMQANLAVCDIETTQGDKIRIEDQAAFLNVIGSIGANRVVHEVRGVFGTFNNGTPNDGMLLRTGAKAANLNAFINDWRVQGDENLFAGGPEIVPANVANLITVQ